jgi:phytoene synthase
MTGIYREVLQRIVADPGQVLTTRVSLAGWEKAWVAARSLALAGPGQTALRTVARIVEGIQVQ